MKHIIKISLISLCLLFIVIGGITKLTAPIETVSADENNEINDTNDGKRVIMESANKMLCKRKENNV